jgi:hypothetical protein
MNASRSIALARPCLSVIIPTTSSKLTVEIWNYQITTTPPQQIKLYIELIPHSPTLPLSHSPTPQIHHARTPPPSITPAPTDRPILPRTYNHHGLYQLPHSHCPDGICQSDLSIELSQLPDKLPHLLPHLSPDDGNNSDYADLLSTGRSVAVQYVDRRQPDS